MKLREKFDMILTAEGPKESRISRLEREPGLESFSLLVFLRLRPVKKTLLKSH